MLLSVPAPAETRSPERVRDLILTTMEQRAQLADRDRYDQLLVQMLLRYAAAERELRDLNQLKNRFLGMAAHDLRNPLSALRGMADLMLGLDLDADRRTEFLREMRKVADDMLRLVNDLLDVAVIESGRLEVRPRATDLAQLVRARAKLVEPLAQQKGISLALQLPDSASGRIDPDRCAQVIDNLLTNAVKFSPPSGAVQVQVVAAPGGLELSVRDSGPGLTGEDMDKLFGAFQKLGAQPTGGEKSTGLGLAIVKKIVDAHGGTIAVRNLPAGGAEFMVRLPDLESGQ